MPLGKHMRPRVPTAPEPLQPKSLPMVMRSESQLAPPGLPQVHAPQVSVPAKPVYQSPSWVPAGQACAPSKIWQTLPPFGTAGTHALPAPQPPPTMPVAQNWALAVHVGGPGLPALPAAVQAAGWATNGVVATP